MAYLTIVVSYKGEIRDPMCIDMKSKITDFDHDNAFEIKVLNSTTTEGAYNYNIAIDLQKMPFHLIRMVESLEASTFHEIKSTLR